MPDPFYPTVAADFFHEYFTGSGRMEPEKTLRIGSTTSYVLTGPQSLHKRTVIIREFVPGQIDFNTATGWAIRLGFMGQLLEWFEQNRNWKDGGYKTP